MADQALIDRVLAAVVPDGPVFKPHPSMARKGNRVHDYRGQTINIPMGSNEKSRNRGLKLPGSEMPSVIGGKFVGDRKMREFKWSYVKGSNLYDDFVGFSNTGAGTAEFIGCQFINSSDSIAPPKNPDKVHKDQRIRASNCYFEWVHDECIEADAGQFCTIEDCIARDIHNVISQRNNRRTHRNGSQIYNSAFWLKHWPDGGSDRDGRPWKNERYEPVDCEGVIWFIDHNGAKGGGSFPPGTYKDCFFVYLGPGSYPWPRPKGVEDLKLSRDEAEELWDAIATKWWSQNDLGAFTDGTDWDDGTGWTDDEVQALPITLNRHKTVAKVIVDLEKPENAVKATMKFRVYDADHEHEGELSINGNPPIELFGERNVSGDQTEMDVEIEAPVEYFVNDENRMVFRWVQTGGYRIDVIEVKFDEAEEPGEPDIGDELDELRKLVAELEANLASVRSQYETLLGDYEEDQEKLFRIREIVA